MGSGLVEIWSQIERSRDEADQWLAVYGEAQADVAKILDGPGTDTEKLAAIRKWTED